jgi:hypothetical protein
LNYSVFVSRLKCILRYQSPEPTNLNSKLKCFIMNMSSVFCHMNSTLTF